MKKAFILTAVLLMAGNIVAQEQTVEDVFLQTTVEKEVIRALMASNTRDEKIKALDFMEEMIVDGRVGEDDEDIIMMLDELGGEGITKTIQEHNRLTNYFPEVRRRAAQLLGEIGGAKAQERLVQILINDFEPMVLSEAVYSLGLIGTDETGYVEQLIASIIQTQDSIRPDNNFAFASIAAIRNLVERRGSDVNPAIFTALIRIAQGNYMRQVREAANELMNDLRNM